MNTFTRAKNYVLDLLFPISCVSCGKEGDIICSSCKNGLHWIPPTCFVCHKLVPPGINSPAGRTCASCQNKSHIYAFLSPFSYQDPAVRDLIHNLKYNQMRFISRILAGFLTEYFDRYRILLPKEAVIVPTPLYKSRERLRGFNQSAEIAEFLGENTGLAVETGTLCKIRKTIPQIELKAEERRKNLIDAFAVGNSAVIQSKTILLLDDVKTTGATLEEAAKVLKENGAKRVWAVTIAH